MIYWNSFADFLQMGNHGPYVWGSVLVMAALMVLEPLLVARGQKQLRQRLRRQLRDGQAERNERSPA